MHHFRYYAIGHSYLKHGPFDGWQTEGFWGMAASAPQCDYFHKVQEGLHQAFDCRLEALAENHAAFERLCTVDATEKTYTASKEYAHIREVMERFQPNLITVFVGGGNTIAKDDASLTLFFEVLYGLIAETKRPEAVAVCVGLKPNIQRLSEPVARRFGLLSADASFLHEIKGRENPYYAFGDYPEYDEKAAAGAVEFRTHPNDKGHAAIARIILEAAKNDLEKLPQGEFTEETSFQELMSEDFPERLRLPTEPPMRVSYFGFNVRQKGDCVTFGSAPGTGASLRAEGFSLPKEQRCFYAELEVEGASENDVLTVGFEGSFGEREFALPIASGMHCYEIPLPAEKEEIRSLRLAPSVKECVVSVRRMGFRK